MPNEDRMTIDEKRKYLGRMKGRYKSGDRNERGRLLSEIEQVTGMHRKSVIRLLNAPDLSRKARRKQRGRKYGPEIDDAIRVIAESLDNICAERVKPALPEMAQHLAKFGEMQVNPGLIGRLERIGVATVGRILRRVRQDTYRLPRKGPERANQVAREIPMGRLPWDEAEPGHFEVDLVHHCGPATVGDYVHTLQMIDVATGWSERVAILGRSQRGMELGFKQIQSRLPIPILQLHTDNGSEFLNNHLIRCWKEAAKGLALMRSRPYQKNDNRFVEQKNDTLVRSYLGKARFDNRVQCYKMNQLYEKMWLYYNFFQPVMRLKEKAALPAEGTYRVKHHYDRAQTPFERLRTTNVLGSEVETRLRALRDGTNPRQLRKEIYNLIDEVLNTTGNAIAPQQETMIERLLVQIRCTEGGKLVPVTFSND
jgi:transposase InsO family protein